MAEMLTPCFRNTIFISNEDMIYEYEKWLINHIQRGGFMYNFPYFWALIRISLNKSLNITL
ncbi:hypothetical protein DCC35_15245 [Mangrovivirga cuniculi]|uniref:Uncharacterized protein n=1 Tax=Mangrovivirga cuniculi TaxID=2715131 RepID=A0A4D7JMW6_9BACT|nr:hypothetical protein DCC35_15245 [Mangrovivirga cuniculi]